VSNFGRNFLPGPTDVHPEVLAAQLTPMFSHRGPRMQELMTGLQPSLQECFGTAEPVFISTSSATGLIEAAVRSGVRQRILVPVGGYFGEYFARIAELCGKEVVRVKVAAGSAITPLELDRQLDSVDVDAVGLVHSESSTGALADLPALVEVVRRRPDVLALVDGVTSVGAMPIEMDRWGVDYYCTGSQKAMALPPGLAFGAASGRFLERADQQPDAGFYFSVKKLVSITRESLPFWTPAVSLLVALECQVRRIAAAGGWTARWARHRAMQELLERWVAARRDLRFMAAQGSRSPAISTLQLPAGTGHVDVLAALFQRGYLVGGPLVDAHGSVIRIGHMGDLAPEHLTGLLTTLEEILR
jgi:aspartate aminotransferase-like enzyme